MKSPPDLGKWDGVRRALVVSLAGFPPSPYVLPVPPRLPCAGAGALSPEKGGALRKQSPQGRRLGVAAVLCGGVFVAPLLLLQHGSAHAARVATVVQHAELVEKEKIETTSLDTVASTEVFFA